MTVSEAANQPDLEDRRKSGALQGEGDVQEDNGEGYKDRETGSRIRGRTGREGGREGGGAWKDEWRLVSLRGDVSRGR